MEKHHHPATLANGRYTIQRQLGDEDDSVYLAYDSVLARLVAIKRIHDRNSPPLPEKGALRAATHLASLQHPNITSIHDIVTLEDEVLVVMEYPRGQHVDQIGEPMEAAFFREFASQCLRALTATHASGILHCSIRPDSIIVVSHQDGGFQVKVLAFDLVKVSTERSLQTIDHSGSLHGSIFMMSPEQLQELPIDHRTDLYSLGCIFYKALTCKYPFCGKSVPNIIASHLSHRFEPLATLRPDLPQPLAAWVEQLFAREPGGRPQSAAEALATLPTIASTLQIAPRKKTVPSRQAPPPAPARSTPKSQKRKVLLPTIGSALLLTGAAAWFLGGFSEKNPHAKMITVADANSPSRTSFSWKERTDIQRREGQTSTITGTIGGFEEDKQGRFHLTFHGASPRDTTLCFDRTKGDFSMLLLKKNVGLDIQATGIVGSDGNRLYLENPTLREFVIPKTSPSPTD